MRLRISIVILLLMVFLGPATSVAAQSEGPVYVVQAGDTLSGIARTFGTDTETLAELNGIADPRSLQPGTELSIPGFDGVQGVLVTRPLEFGETLTSLARRHNLAPEAIVRLNRIVNPGRMYHGQMLILPEAPQGSEALARVDNLLVGPGETALETALRAGVNPWSVRLTSSVDGRLWQLPGEVLAAPGGQQAPTDLASPVTSVRIQPDAVAQGHTLTIWVSSQADVEVEGQLGPWPLRFAHSEPGRQVALQGVHAMADPGLYDLEIRFTRPGGGLSYARTQPIRLRSGGYGFDPVLTVPEETLDPGNIRAEEEVVSAVLREFTPERLWSGRFDFPSDYYTDAFSSFFGTRRNYNNTGYTSYHSGLDFFGGIGVEILAPAKGEVAFAQGLTVRGNTIILDHGWGVFTVYMHQSEILVSEGEEVERGDVIGLVGATGRVTGPHLHWEVRVGSVAVDPLDWVQHEYPGQPPG